MMFQILSLMGPMYVGLTNKYKMGVIISNDLTWNSHVHYIVTKACKRLYMLYQTTNWKEQV